MPLQLPAVGGQVSPFGASHAPPVAIALEVAGAGAEAGVSEEDSVELVQAAMAMTAVTETNVRFI